MEVQGHCEKCQNPATSRCSRCILAFYCSRECQTGHWSVHKKVCGKTASPAPASAPASASAPAPAPAPASASALSSSPLASPSMGMTSPRQYFEEAAGALGVDLSHLSVNKEKEKKTTATKPPAASPASPPKVPLDEKRYQKMAISVVEAGRTYKGKFLEGVVVNDPFKMEAVHMDIKDDIDDVITLSISDFPGAQGTLDYTRLPPGADPVSAFKCPLAVSRGQRVKVFDPHCKVGIDGRVVIQVDDCSKFKVLGN